MSGDDEIGSLLDEPTDPWGVSRRGLYRFCLWALFTVGLIVLWAAVEFRLLRDWMWAAAVFTLTWGYLRLWYASVRRERVLLMAFVEMSDLHSGYLQEVHDAIEADPPELWIVRDGDPKAFWQRLVRRRLAEFSSLGVEPIEDSEVGLTLEVGSRYGT